METEFSLLISFRTPDGFKACGQYFMGNDVRFAESVFTQLQGREDIDDRAVLHLDLIQAIDGLPVKIKTISCRFSELCSNCQLITREIFREHAVARSFVDKKFKVA